MMIYMKHVTLDENIRLVWSDKKTVTVLKLYKIYIIFFLCTRLMHPTGDKTGNRNLASVLPKTQTNTLYLSIV